MRRATKRRFFPVHPGVLLSRDFLKAKRITHTRLAKRIGMPLRRIDEIVQGKPGITADVALQLGKFFGMAPPNGQDLEVS